MAKAVGVGGTFLRAPAPQALSARDAKHFGIQLGEGGSQFLCRAGIERDDGVPTLPNGHH
jgi:hypothetical protein